MSVPHKGGLDELVIPHSIPNITDVARNMLSFQEEALDMRLRGYFMVMSGD